MLSEVARAQLVACAAGIRAVLEADGVERTAAEAERAAAAQQTCPPHPREGRIPAPSMQHPDAFICGACRAAVEE